MGDRTPSTLAEAYQRHGYRLSDYVAPEEHERIRQETLNELKRELASVTTAALPDYDRAVQLRELEKQLKGEFEHHKLVIRAQEAQVNERTVEQAVRHLREETPSGEGTTDKT